MEPFDVDLENPEGVTLTPADAMPSAPPTPLEPLPSAAAPGLLPNVSDMLGPRPVIPMPAPPPPPPSPTQDPRQQLLALIATGMAIGQGVHGGGVGALEGFAQTQQALRQDQLTRYNKQVTDYQQQRQQAESNQRRLDSEMITREQQLKQSLANFKTQATTLTSKADYDSLAEAYGNSLRAAGYRTIDPNWLRQNIPYVKPSQASLADKAFKAWNSNPNNKRLLDENPASAMASVVEVDLNGDGVKERMPLAKLAEAAGHGFAHDANGGLIAIPVTTKVGQSAFDMKLDSLTKKFAAENRRPPNEKEHDALVDQAILASKEKPETPPTNNYSLQPEIDPATGKQTGRFFSFDTKTNTWSQPTGVGPNATKGGATVKPLPATNADQLSGMNMAEVEGVKVLRDLKRAGLDQSNNPLDPRWQKFVATRLKMESGDLNKADIQQRTAAVNAVLTRGLMGGRPSQYVAEMIQQHMPQGDMSGAKLYKIMQDVLQQAGERRAELENLTGRERGSLKPVSGETYEQFIQSQQQALDAAKAKLGARGR